MNLTVNARQVQKMNFKAKVQSNQELNSEGEEQDHGLELQGQGRPCPRIQTLSLRARKN